MSHDVIENAKIYTLIVDDSRYGHSLYAQHGVSFLIEVETKDEQKKILFDTGQSAEPILYNMGELGLDPGTIDMIFLSHCHYDHTGGLVEMLKAIDSDSVPIIAHPGIFRECITIDPSMENKGITEENNKEKVKEEGGELLLLDSPSTLMDGVMSTGEIKARYDFEDIGLDQYTIENGELVKDDSPDDMSIIIKLSDGIVVVSGCSHAGIVSIVRKGIEITGESDVKAVIGGFHLLDAEKERIEKTKDKFKEIRVDKVYAGHCTGLRAECTLQNGWKDDFDKLQSGKIFEFG